MPKPKTSNGVRHKTPRAGGQRRSIRGSPVTNARAARSPVPVVGIGASAGGLAAVTELLKHLPSEIDAAIVIIQHLDPRHESLGSDILARVTPLPVDEVRDGMRIQPCHVYVIPPNHNMRLVRGALKLSKRADTRGPHLPIDVFFRSLAEERKEEAIGVVLSGIASDGTQGVQAIKAEGGLTFAQDPVSAQYDGMPRSAIASGAVDVVATPPAIAVEIARVCAQMSGDLAGPRRAQGMASARAHDGHLLRILALVRTASGVDLTHYKHSTIERRIARRLVLLKIKDLRAYADHLGKHPEEATALFADILIHVSGFFRDPKAYEALQTRILPRCMKNRDPASPFRVWVPGCSTGEEAYSIAIVFLELLNKTGARPALQVFASDISEPSLQKARSGVYPESIVKNVSRARLNRFFEKAEGGGYRIAKSIRNIVLFSKHDLTADPPFARIDLVACRNVLIYFDAELQKRVVPVLHYALNSGGILWLGRSETLSSFGSLFALEDRTNKFYSKKSLAVPVRLRFSVARFMPEALAARQSVSVVPTLQSVQAEADRVAIQQYSPPGVVVNESAEIVQVRGRPAPYVELTQGQASLNLFKLAHPDIVSNLRYLLNSARRESAPTSKDGLTLKKGRDRRTFRIRIVPLRLPPAANERFFSIFFEGAGSDERPETPKPRSQALPKGKPQIEQPDQMVDERRYHHELIEEYETTQEELVAANEELQSTNEELQSTNEELETAKEELQSANEEMTTINDELQIRNAEMSRLSNDLTNLLASVDIPIVMVGPDARIRRFTPMAGQMFNLIPGDVGRPIGDIRSPFQTLDLDDTVAEVMATLSLEELEARDKQGAWYRLQVRPYRTSDNRIDGAVISLTDISVLKLAAETLSAANDDARNIIETMPTAILVISPDRRVQMANGSFCRLFQISPTDAEGVPLQELCDRVCNLPAVVTMLDSVLREGTPFRDLEVSHDFPRIGHREMILHGTSTRLTGAGHHTALLAFEDRTARQEAADRLLHTERKYRHLLEDANDGILIVDGNGHIDFVNRRLEAMFGYSPGELNARSFEILVPDQYRESLPQHHAAFVRHPKPRDMSRALDLYGKRKDGTAIPVEISLSPVTVGSDVVVTALVRDVSERKKMEADRQELLARETDARQQAERANRVKDEFLATLSHELRTPLSTILSWAQLLRLGNPDAATSGRAIASIEQSAKDQGQLIDDLLDVSRIQAGKLLLDLRDIDPTSSIVTALDSVRTLAESKAIPIHTEFDRSAGPIRADSGRLQQVFRNLFVNAIKFTPAGGTIRVRSKQKTEPDRLEIQVEDSGKGIKPEFLPHLFTRFSQEDSSIKRVFGGVGLGLSIVRNLVEMHGGTVKAQSPGEGKGSVFTVTLPSASRGARQDDVRGASMSRRDEAPKTEQPVDLGGLRVLIIDDLEDAREALSAMLRSSGAQVETAATTASGLAAVTEFTPHVVLCDIAMPEEDGFSFIRQLRQLQPPPGGTVLAIAVTAFAGPENVRRSLEAGFDAHLSKPVDVADLDAVIAKLTGRQPT